MPLVLQITSGSRAGQRVELTKPIVMAGRHPESDLRFDAQRDLDVSTRHAEFRSGPGGWSVNDLGSTNGTWVNGIRIQAQQEIRAGDVITFGAQGPRISVVATGSVADSVATPRTEFRPSQATPRPKTEERIAIAVAAQTGSLKKFVIGFSAVVVMGVAVLVWLSQRSAAQSKEQIARIVQQSDSMRKALERALADASVRTAGFDSLVRKLRNERDQLTTRLQAGGGDVANITSQIDALDRRTNQALSLTNRQISDANGKAVGYIVVEDQSKHFFGGTAFCVTPGGMFVTNRHVVMDEQGRPPNRIVVYFADTPVPLPAHFVSAASDPGTDIAFVQLDKAGQYPTIRGIAQSSSIGVGDPIIVIGFPMGTDLAQQGETKKTSLTAGFVSKVLPNELQINAFSAQGSSGSPVFDSRGHVIGVLNAGQGGTSSVISFVVPSALLIAALPQEAKAIVKQ